MLQVANIPLATLESLLSRYELQLQVQSDGETITGSYWGDSEAGVVGRTVFVRTDTPIHSLLHEMSHIICMTAERRQHLQTDAGGDDLEEAAVCYLQIILSDEIEGAGRGRLFRDMDAWGYNFRLGDTSSWFERDAEDARKWLIDCNLLTVDSRPSFQLRG